MICQLKRQNELTQRTGRYLLYNAVVVTEIYVRFVIGRHICVNVYEFCVQVY